MTNRQDIIIVGTFHNANKRPTWVKTLIYGPVEDNETERTSWRPAPGDGASLLTMRRATVLLRHGVKMQPDGESPLRNAVVLYHLVIFLGLSLIWLHSLSLRQSCLTWRRISDGKPHHPLPCLVFL